MALKTQQVALDKLQQDPDNARTHDARNLAAIQASLERFGQVTPLVVQKSTGHVIGGNGTLRAMQALGWDKASVVYQDLSEVQAKALSVALNRSAELASWDNDRLGAILEEIAGCEDISIGAVGFSDDEMHAIMGLGDYVHADNPEPVAGGSDDSRPRHGKPVQLTAEQREVFDQACCLLRDQAGEDYSEGRCLELMVADFIASHR